MKKFLVMLTVLSGLCFLNTACSDSDDSSSSTGTAVDEGVKYLDWSFNEFTFGETNKNWSKLSDGWKKFSCSEDSMKGHGSGIFYPTKMNGGFSVTVKKESGKNGAGYGVVFGAAGDKKNYYKIMITVNGGSITQQTKNGTSNNLTEWIKTKSIKTDYDAENKITVVKENENWAIYVNDEFVHLIENPEFTGGYVGFYAFVSENETPSETPVVEYFKFDELDTPNKTVVDGGQDWKGLGDSGFSNNTFCSNSYWSKLLNGWTRMSCSNDEYKGKNPWLFYPKSDVTGFTAKIKKESGSENARLNLIFCASDKNNLYGVGISPTGEYGVAYKSAGTLQTLKQSPADSTVKTGLNQENEISVNKVNGIFKISINGKEIYTIENPEFNNGYVGFQVDVDSTDTPSTTPVVAYCKFTAIN